MAGRAKRLTLMVGIAAAVAVIVGAVVATEPLAAPKAKPPKGNAFVITTAEADECDMTWGTFVATGAIEDTGQAYWDWCDPNRWVVLYSSRGRMTMEVTYKKKDSRFEIVAADGEYAGLVGVTGSYSERTYRTGDIWIRRRFEGSIP